MSEPKVTKDVANRTLTVEKDFQAPLDRVWSAWTNPEKLTRWWGPKGWPVTSHAFEFREGGSWHFSMTGPDGSQVWVLLEYLKIRPMTELHAEDSFSNPQGTKTAALPNSTWEVGFRKLAAQSTRVTTRLRFATEADLEKILAMGFETGYASALDNLTEALTGRSQPQTVVSKDGTKLVYEKLGSGPPVILVSGAMISRGFSAQTDLAAALSAQNTVYNYDRRGRGDSGDTAPYAVDREIDDLEALIEVAGGSAAVYGMSSGAILALQAARRGLKISKLVLYEPPFIVEAGDRRPPPDGLAVVTAMIARGQRAAAVTYFMTQVFGMPAIVAWMMRLTPFWKPCLAVAPSIPHDLAVTGDYSVPDCSALDLPSLVLYGDQTQPLLIHGAQALAKTLPKATLTILPGVNHQVAVADLAPVVAEFLAKAPDA
jgi:uncharacterized protein YndB with AHSA1/START domain/pimeloyl-ACP methyl ester carboxylesterase